MLGPRRSDLWHFSFFKNVPGSEIFWNLTLYRNFSWHFQIYHQNCSSGKSRGDTAFFKIFDPKIGQRSLLRAQIDLKIAAFDSAAKIDPRGVFQVDFFDPKSKNFWPKSRSRPHGDYRPNPSRFEFSPQTKNLGHFGSKKIFLVVGPKKNFWSKKSPKSIF